MQSASFQEVANALRITRRSIGARVFVEAVFGYHQPEILEMFAQGILKLRKYYV
jgi:hypothetical protein